MTELRDLVRAAARTELLPFCADVVRHAKTDGSLVTVVDHAMQRRLQQQLAARWPDYAFLGEEMDGSEQARIVRRGIGGFWCLDPLDGTSNFAAGVPFFAVSLALVLEGVPVLGVVYDPVRDECFTAQRGHGAHLESVALGSVAPAAVEFSRALACVDFKRLAKPLAAQLATAPPYGSQRNFGSSSLEWCWLAAGRFQLYLHGGQMLWDYTAGHLILTESGGQSTTLTGDPVYTPDLAPRSVVASRDAGLFHAWQAWLMRQHEPSA